MKTRSTSRPEVSEERRSPSNLQASVQLTQAPAGAMPDVRVSSLTHMQHQQRASDSGQVAQLKAYADMMAGRSVEATVQRVEDEKLLQGKFATVQQDMDDELLQGKFEPVQRMDDDELLQGKFETMQRMEEDELLQGKFEPVQRMEDEELLQGKFDPVQRMEEDELLQGKFTASRTAQLEEKANDTGMPNQLKSGIESLSGMSMDHVKVHYNSDRPAQLNAHAYAQGSDIHMAPGQEQHLPHEAWHVVQQMQGRVQPTTTVGAAQVNDNPGLENEATAMGEKALQRKVDDASIPFSATNSSSALSSGEKEAIQRQTIA